MSSRDVIAQQIRIVADDMTGALDSSGPLATPAAPISVSWAGRAPPRAPRAAYDIATREVDAATADARSRDIARRWWRDFDGLAFKKVDSVWRGHAALEIAGAVHDGGFDVAVVAPAFPAEGRTTRLGRQWIARDGIEAAGADLVAELRAAGLATASERYATARTRAYVCDAEDQDALERVVGRYATTGERVLWCGARGLAAALATHRFGRLADGRVSLPTVGDGPVIVVVGSNHVVSAKQADQLARTSGVTEWRIDLVAPSVPREPVATPVLLIRFVASRTVDPAQAMASAAVALAQIAHAVPTPGFVVVAGGETLRALCGEIGAQSLAVDGETASGFPLSRIVGGPWSGVVISSKSGSFGGERYLAELIASLRIGAAKRRTCPA